VAGYQAGAQAKELAKRWQINRHTVAAVLERAGVLPRARGLTPAQMNQACQLYCDGWSLARIGEKLGVTANTARRYLLLAGVVMRSPTVRPTRH
jgi:DNA-binding CsgD family transcriptional regulator